MYTLEQILVKLRQYKPDLQRKYPVSKLGVFGSYARGEATENSDIDIAVEITGPMGLNFVTMADEIEELFGIKTDVVPLRAIKPKYLVNVQKDIVYAWTETFCNNWRYAAVHWTHSILHNRNFIWTIFFAFYDRGSMHV